MAAKGFTLDLNEKYTRIGESKLTNGKVEMLGVGILETVPFFYTTPTDKLASQQAEIISKLYTSLRIKERDVHVVIPDTYAYSQIVEMPNLKEKELLNAIRYQADEFIPMPIEETNLDIEILHEDPVSKKLRILIVASPKEIISQVQKSVFQAGLNPVGLENELSAAGRLVSELLKPAGKSLLLVNFGYSSTSLYLIDPQSSGILLTRTVKLGLSLFIKDVRVNLNIDEAKAMEILRTIGLSANSSYQVDVLISPIMKELLVEIEKFINLSREKMNVTVDQISLYNFGNYVLQLPQSIQEHFSISTDTMGLEAYMVDNPVFKSFMPELPSLVSVIAGSIA